jgi:vacuolar-type H+-ATPase catalytic subunit A/Vma1
MASRFDYITEVLDRSVEEAQLIDVKGRVVQVVGTIIKASVPGVKVGEVCILRDPWENVEMQAEVIGFNKETVLLTALGQMTGLSVETEVIPTRRVHMVSVGESLLGRVLDGLGRPIDSDEKGPLLPEGYYPVYADPPNPLERKIISKPISLGVKALDAMLTCGEGQRMGIFAAAGGGKSTLLAQIVRNTEADVTVLASYTDEEIRKALRDTYVAAQFAMNPYYELPDPVQAPCREATGRLAAQDPEISAGEMAAALFEAEREPGAFSTVSAGRSTRTRRVRSSPRGTTPSTPIRPIRLSDR